MMFLTELRPMQWGTPTAQNPLRTAKAALAQAINTPTQQTLPQAPFQQAPLPQLAAFQPRVSLCETPEAYMIQLEAPGVAPETLELVLVNDELAVRGEKTPETFEHGQWHVNERAFGAFERTFRFPTHVTQEGVQAETTNGILTIRVAKAKEALPRKIQVIAR